MTVMRGLTFAIAAFGALAAHPLGAQDQTTVYRGAEVWTGEGFEKRDLAVRAGIFVQMPTAADREVDVTGRFITPALADAHNHVTNPADRSSNGFLARGEYYVWNPTTIWLGDGAAAYFARPDTYDVKLSYGGITEPRGHPEKLYVEILSERVYGGRKDFLGDAFQYGRNAEEIATALDLLVEQGADFVKGYLLHSEEYAERRDDDAFYGSKGMNPENAALLVSLATERDLLVVFHVETAADLVTAAEAGAFAAMHLPGYSIDRQGNDALGSTLRPGQARIVAESGMLLVPTYIIGGVGATRAQTDLERTRAALYAAIQRHNLVLLREAGATFLIGTDGFGGALDEMRHLAGLEVFEDAELLRIAFGTGPALFPDRRISCFDIGCEADFLVLAESPLGDLAALSEMTMRVKAGRAIGEKKSQESG